jgi:PAS domain S-box-containing protein
MTDSSNRTARISYTDRRGDLAKPQILFVEDEQILREHLAEVLSDEFTVETASDGEQALLAIMRSRPALVVTDVVMPTLDGIELLKLLRSTPNTQMIPVLLISGRAPDEMRIEGFEEGADGYLAKPYTQRELRARIRSMIQSARLRDEASRREALEQSERRAMAERAAILESITDAFYALDREWRFTYVNQRALRYLEASREALLGQVIWDAVPAIRGTVFQEQYERAVREQISVAFEGFSPFSKRWVDVRAYPTPQGLAVNFRDITDEKHAQEALRNAEERYRAFVTNSSEGIWRYELDEPLDLSMPAEAQIEHIYRHGRLAELNDAMARMYGFERAEELLGAKLHQTLPRESAAAQAYLQRVIELRFAFTDLESAEHDRLGRLHYFANSMVPVIEAGQLVRVWGMQRDVTERKRAEDALRESDRRKDEFLATLAHELRNPLAPIRNGIQIVGLGATAGSALERTVTMMDRQLKHLVRLVDDLLDVGRINLGKIELRPESVVLSEVLARSMEANQSAIESRQQALTFEATAAPVIVRGDFERLTQVFSNLLANSAKYTQAGGQIRLSLQVEGSSAVVRVSDSGIGIPAEFLDRVFDLFSQVRTRQQHPAGGLGIGLALVRSIVQLHGGTVEASSAGLGRGSTFTVQLPLHESEAVPELARPAGTQSMEIGRRRVVVVDDNPDAASSLALLLEMSGHEVFTAFDGPQALKLVSAHKPDAVFLDLGMPGMDGFEVARRIRATPAGMNMMVIALTGWGQETDRLQTRAAGFDHHLIKPVSAEQLAEVLKG